MQAEGMEGFLKWFLLGLTMASLCGAQKDTELQRRLDGYWRDYPDELQNYQKQSVETLYKKVSASDDPAQRAFLDQIALLHEGLRIYPEWKAELEVLRSPWKEVTTENVDSSRKRLVDLQADAILYRFPKPILEVERRALDTAAAKLAGKGGPYSFDQVVHDIVMSNPPGYDEAHMKRELSAQRATLDRIKSMALLTGERLQKLEGIHAETSDIVHLAGDRHDFESSHAHNAGLLDYQWLEQARSRSHHSVWFPAFLNQHEAWLDEKKSFLLSKGFLHAADEEPEVVSAFRFKDQWLRPYSELFEKRFDVLLKAGKVEEALAGHKRAREELAPGFYAKEINTHVAAFCESQIQADGPYTAACRRHLKDVLHLDYHEDVSLTSPMVLAWAAWGVLAALTCVTLLVVLLKASKRKRARGALREEWLEGA